MRVGFQAYRGRDGTAMIYLNNDRKVSVGISPDHGFPLRKKTREGMDKLIDAARIAFEINAALPPAPIESHAGEAVVCGPYTLLVACGGPGRFICGQPTKDLTWIVRGGGYVPAGKWMSDEIVETAE